MDLALAQRHDSKGYHAGHDTKATASATDQAGSVSIPQSDANALAWRAAPR
jgi:hypothetical protein